MDLFGKSTKSYTNSKESNSGAFCTIPVKYSFEDKDTRIRAETTLSNSCKVSCSTPYPIILRECIKQVVNSVKAKYPGEFVRTNVDPVKMSLSVARRANNESGWSYFKEYIPLPQEVLNVDAQKVPEGFRLTNLPECIGGYTPTKPERGRQGKKSSVMEVADSNE